MYLRWTDVGSDEEAPRASVPGWPECGPSHYKLQQWCIDGQNAGFWRDIEYGCENVPPSTTR